MSKDYVLNKGYPGTGKLYIEDSRIEGPDD